MEQSPILVALSGFGTLLESMITWLSDVPILMTMFAGGLFIVGAKVFKRIKNSVK